MNHLNFAFVVEHSAHERVQLFEQIFKPSIKRLKKKTLTSQEQLLR